MLMIPKSLLIVMGFHRFHRNRSLRNPGGGGGPFAFQSPSCHYFVAKISKVIDGQRSESNWRNVELTTYLLITPFTWVIFSD